MKQKSKNNQRNPLASPSSPAAPALPHLLLCAAAAAVSGAPQAASEARRRSISSAASGGEADVVMPFNMAEVEQAAREAREQAERIGSQCMAVREKVDEEDYLPAENKEDLHTKYQVARDMEAGMSEVGS